MKHETSTITTIFGYLRTPPPTRHGVTRSNSRTNASLASLGLPCAASRSTTAISPATLNAVASSRASSRSMRLADVSPPTSCTTFPPSKSIEGTMLCDDGRSMFDLASLFFDVVFLFGCLASLSVLSSRTATPSERNSRLIDATVVWL